MNYFYKHPRTFTLSVWLGMALAMLLLSFFTSCAVHKTAFKHSDTLDSSSVRTEQQSDVSRHDSTINAETANTYRKVTEYVYDTLLLHDTVQGKAVTVFKYIPRKAMEYETGTSNTRQTGTFTNLDSTGSVKHDSTGLAKSVETVSKTTDVKPTIGLCVLYVVVGLAVLMGVGWVVRKFVA